MTRRGSPEDILIGRVLRLDHRAALDLLRDMARDRAVLAELRRLWAQETGARTLCFTSDDRVLTQLAARVAAGSLVIASVLPSQPEAVPPVLEAPAEAAAPPPSPAPERAAASVAALSAAATAEATDAMRSSVDEGRAAAVGAEAEARAGAEGAGGSPVKSWVEIALIGEDGEPLGGVRYRLALRDGRVFEGVLGDDGLVRLDGLEEGECTLTFPDLDMDAWVAVP